VIALAAGIGLIGLVAWTVNGALGVGTASQSAEVSHAAGRAAHHPAAAAAAAPSTPAAGSPRPAATASPSARSTPRPAGSSARKHPARRPGNAATAAGGSRACPGAAIVLSLFAAKYSYPAHALPQFEVDVVSTAPRTCTFDLGAQSVQLLIRAGGKDRVWGSADCVRSPGHRVTRLVRGVPAVVRISWDRKTSAPGCRLPRKAAQPGTYTATAYSGKLLSPTLIFVLSAPGIAVP